MIRPMRCFLRNSRVLEWLMCLLAIAIAFDAAAQNVSAPAHPSAGSGEHLWFVLPVGDRIELLHHALSMDGPYFRVASRLNQVPAAIAARDDRAWIVFEPTGEGSSSANRRRQVFTLRAVVNPATGMLFYDPPGRLEILESLPADGRLAHLASSQRGPLALIVPPAWREAGVQAGEGSIAAEPGLARPTVFALEGSTWREYTLPESIAGWEPVAIITNETDDRWRVLAQHRRDRALHRMYERSLEEDEAWTELEFTGPERPFTVVNAVGQTWLAGFTPEARRIDLFLVRDESLLPALAVEATGAPWTLAGYGPSLVLVERNGEAAPTIRFIDPVLAQTSDPVEMATQPIMGATRLYMPFILGMVLTIVLLVFVLRPSSADGDVVLPAAMQPLDFSRRFLALAIDSLPGAILALLLNGLPFEDLFRLPFWAISLDQSPVILVWAGVTVLHGAIMEMFSGRSIGKMLVGGRVVTLTGQRAGIGAVLLRHLFKFVVLVIPPLGVFVLVNPHRQGLGETISRTVVVGVSPTGARSSS